MKKMSKRIIAAIVTAIMVFTAIPLSVFATETDATVTQGNNDVSVTATNSLGAMLTDTLETAGMEPDGDYTITDLTFESNTATVSYLNIGPCELVVAVYDENTMQMLTSEVTSVEADSASAMVTFTKTLPEFFVAKAFLLDNDYAPLCKEYTSRRNTTEFVEFMALETTDFEEDKVINLDESEDNNFLVLGDDVQKIKGDTETNILVSSDIETNTYVFKNIDSNISSLKKGDIFHLDNGDMENLVVIKVASITIDGTTATIVAETASLEDVFEVIKLDSDELKTGVEVDSAESGTISEDGEITFDAVEAGNANNPWKETKTFSLEKEFKNDSGDSVKITGTAVFTLEAHYKIYVSRKWSEISFIINPSAVVTVTVDGVISERRYKIGHFYFSMYGVTIGVEPEFVFSASANITLTGTWKTQIGFGFNTSDGFVNKSTSPTFEPTVKIAGQFYIGFNLAPYLTFVHEAVIDIKFVAEIGITIKATYSNNSGHSCDNCIDGDVLWSANLDVDLAILWGLIDTSKNENYKGDIWNKEPTKFADFYYSFDNSEFGWGECPYKTISIPSDAIKFDGHYYTIIRKKLNWSNAKKYCESLNGHLITITSEKENKFALSLLENYPNDVYTIGIYEVSEGNWSWVTNETILYTNWGYMQPDNDVISSNGFGEHFGFIVNYETNWGHKCLPGEWNDSCINTESYFICEWDSGTKAETSTVSTDSTTDFILNSIENEIITTDPYCFQMNGVAGNSYTLLNVTDYSDSFVLSNSNLLYIDQVVADENGVITSSYIPKAYDENSTTLLIGDFGSGTEIKKLAKVNELGIVSVTAKTDYIRYGDIVPVEVVTTGTPAKIRFVDTDGNTVTINSSVNNGDGTCTWKASITMLKENETYSVYAKYANGWDVNCKEITLTAQPFDDSYHSTEFEVISDGVIYNGMNTLTFKTGMDVSKVQLYKNGNTWTYTADTATVAEENGVKVWTIKMNFSQLGDQTYYVRTRSKKTAFEVVDTLNLTVYSK